MKIRREQIGRVMFRSMLPKLRWLWTFIALVCAVMSPFMFFGDIQMSTELLSRQPAIGQPVVDQLETLTKIFGLCFVLSVIMALVAWRLWALGRSELEKKNKVDSHV